MIFKQIQSELQVGRGEKPQWYNCIFPFRNHREMIMKSQVNLRTRVPPRPFPATPRWQGFTQCKEITKLLNNL